MTQSIASTTNTLNKATVSADRSRSAYAGAAFGEMNAMAPAAAGSALRNAPGALDDTQVRAGTTADRMLADLNLSRVSPKLGAALAAVNSAVAAGQDQQKADESDARHAQLTEHAQKLVSQTFFGPMLKRMRDSPFKSELFEGGRGGQVFTSMFDQQLADRMAGSANNKLVASLVRRLEKLGQPEAVPSNPYENVRIHVAPGLGS